MHWASGLEQAVTVLKTRVQRTTVGGGAMSWPRDSRPVSVGLCWPSLLAALTLGLWVT